MRFSVIVPIYGVEKYIHKCVDTILEQTYRDFELILVDDGSPDNCPQICDEYAKMDDRVRVIHKKNGGLVSARNAGIAAARGDYICYVDGDDWIKPDLLSFVNDKIDGPNGPVDIVTFGGVRVFADHETAMGNHAEPGYYDKEKLKKEIYPYLFSDRREDFDLSIVIPGYAWNKVMRRGLLLEHYARDERIRMFEDVAFTYECILNADSMYICSEPLYCYRKTNEAAMTEQKRVYLADNYVYLLEYLHSRLDGYGPDIARQLNDFAAVLVIRDIPMQLATSDSLLQATKNLAQGIRSTGMLRFIKLRDLPLKPKIVILLLKMRLYLPLMAVSSVTLNR